MRVVVTGGAGFIGANVCTVLASTPGIDRVVAFDNLSTGSAKNVTDGVEIMLGTSVTAVRSISPLHTPGRLYTSPPGQAFHGRSMLRSRAT